MKVKQIRDLIEEELAHVKGLVKIGMIYGKTEQQVLVEKPFYAGRIQALEWVLLYMDCIEVDEYNHKRERLENR